jgi:predicted nuclease of predicted toxin-antitoxin system
MRVLIDACVGYKTQKTLEALGADVAHMLQIEPSANDADVIAGLLRQERLLITYDRRLPTLIFFHGLTDPGILLVRDLDLTPDERAEVTARVVRERYDELLGHLATISRGCLRIHRGGASI